MSKRRFSLRRVFSLFHQGVRFALSREPWSKKKKKLRERFSPRLLAVRRYEQRFRDALLVAVAERSFRYAAAALHGRADYAVHCWDELATEDSKLFFSSGSAEGLSDDILAILRELRSGGYPRYAVTLACPNGAMAAARQRLRAAGLRRIRLVAAGSSACVRAAAEARYLLMDALPYRDFYKKDGQVLLSLRRDRPFREEGRALNARGITEPGEQRLLAAADCLMARSEASMHDTLKRYQLENAAQGTILYSGYPGSAAWIRAAAGRDRALSARGRSKIYVYVPAESESLRPGCLPRLYDRLEYYLTQLDERLADDECVLLACRNPFPSGNRRSYRHIRLLPKDTEPSSVAADAWIVDYFDDVPACVHSGARVVRFAFDEPLLRGKRNPGLPYSESGFPAVCCVDELVKQLRSGAGVPPETVARFAPHDSANSARALCQTFFLGKPACKTEKIPDNGRENVLIFTGTLVLHGLTVALLNLLSALDLQKYNYFICMLNTGVEESGSRMALLPDGVSLLCFDKIEKASSAEQLQIDRLLHGKTLTDEQRNTMEGFFRRCNRISFPSLRMDHGIQFPGYSWRILLQFADMPCQTALFVHNDMGWEIELKRINPFVLKHVLKRYDSIAVVTEDILENTVALGAPRDRVLVVNNLIPVDSIRRRGEEPLRYSMAAGCTASPEELRVVLERTAVKFITVGRFEKQKGHALLIEAFDRYYTDHPDSCLILIGGRGKLLEETVALARSKASAERIFFLSGLENPMPIVRACDLFLLPSLYEGFGLALAEALALGVPAAASDIPGPRGFMKQYGGVLMATKAEAIHQTMEAFSRGEIRRLDIDFDAYNRNAVRSFEEGLLSGSRHPNGGE